MKTYKAGILRKLMVMYPCAALLAVGFSTTSQAQPSEIAFACEVMTAAGVSGLVLVQAPTMNEAKELIKDSTAQTLSGANSETRSIIQCINARTGKFSDATFQKFYKSLPM